MWALLFCIFAWQNYANYLINVELDDTFHYLYGKETITYRNLSPDTLDEIWLLLYPNAFRKGSNLFKEIEKRFGEYRFRYLDDNDYGAIEIETLRISGIIYDERTDGVPLRIPLKYPLLPGSELKVEVKFKVKIPKIIARLGHKGKHYEITQWYPKMAVYDSMGWHHDDYHVFGEFYGDFGTYDVSITLPRDYIVGATGRLIEPVSYWDYLDSLALFGKDERAIFKGEGEGDQDKMTLRYLAHRVHDFAWVADPEYIPLRTDYEDVEILLLASKRHLEDFKYIKDEVPSIFEKFEEWYGPYPYAQYTVAESFADRGGGMEYPQLVLIRFGGKSRIPAFGPLKRLSLLDVVAHETAHQWFYGVLANNEIDEPWLDEAFASFSEGRFIKWRFPPDSLRRLTGFMSIFGFDRFYPVDFMDFGLYRTLNSHWDEPVVGLKAYQMENYGTIIYGKGRKVLQMLSLVVGDSTRDRILKEYYHDYSFHHPTTRDFERVCERVSGKRLDWFFNDWLRSTKKCDFSLGAVRVEEKGARVEVVQRGDIEMPVDVLLEDGKGNRWIKTLERGERVLYFPGVKDVKYVEIDPFGRVPETDEWNNSKPRKFRIRPLFELPRIDAYQIGLVPILFHNGVEGWKMSLFAYGHQGSIRHLGDLGAGFRTGDKRPFGALSWKEPIFEGDGSFGFSFVEWGGFTVLSAGLERSFKRSYYSPLETKVSLSLNYENLWDRFAFDTSYYEKGSEAFLSLSVGKRGANPIFSWAFKAMGRAFFRGYLGGKFRLGLDPFMKFIPKTTLYFGISSPRAPIQYREFIEGEPFLPSILLPLLAHNGRLSPLGEGMTVGDGLPALSGSGIYGTKKAIISFELPLLGPLEVFADGGWIYSGSSSVGSVDVSGGLGNEGESAVKGVNGKGSSRFGENGKSLNSFLNKKDDEVKCSGGLGNGAGLSTCPDLAGLPGSTGLASNEGGNTWHYHWDLGISINLGPLKLTIPLLSSYKNHTYFVVKVGGGF